MSHTFSLNKVPLWGHRELLLAWTFRTIRARYQQSILGALWAILQPAATVAIFSVIFTQFVPIDTGDTPYVIFSYTAMVPWTLFSASMHDMAESMVANMELVGKIYFPREIIPLAALLARSLDALIASVLLVAMILLFRVPVFIEGWLWIPVIVLIQFGLSLGLGLALAALNVFYRDVRYLITLGIQIWFYATPIIYPVETVPSSLRSIYFLNPMAGVIEAYRAVLLYESWPGPYLIPSAVMSLAVLIFGYGLFKRLEPQFADVI